jgi:hypothetical protein
MIKMDKNYHDQETEISRSGIEQRALWLYNFYIKAKENGLDPEAYTREALYACGCMKGQMNFTKTDSLITFGNEYQSEIGRKSFDGVITTLTEDELVCESGYCPLVAMWNKLTDNDELIATLCDIAMDGDRGIMAQFPQYSFELTKSIPAGDGKCQVEVRRKKDGQSK